MTKQTEQVKDVDFTPVAGTEEFNPSAFNPVAGNALAIRNDDDDKFIVNLTSRQTAYCSMKVKEGDLDTKKMLFNATNNSEYRIKDMIGETIMVRHVWVEVVECIKEGTGEVEKCPRIVLIDENNKGYQAVSLGVYNAVKRMLATFGDPSLWKAPLGVKIKLISKGQKSILTLNVL